MKRWEGVRKAPADHLVRPNGWYQCALEHPLLGRKLSWATKNEATEALIWTKNMYGIMDEMKIQEVA